MLGMLRITFSAGRRSCSRIFQEARNGAVELVRADARRIATEDDSVLSEQKFLKVPASKRNDKMRCAVRRRPSHVARVMRLQELVDRMRVRSVDFDLVKDREAHASRRAELANVRV